MKVFRSLFAVILAIGIFPASAYATTTKTTEISGNTAEEIVASMTLQQKVEQMIMPAMRTWTKSSETTATNFTQMNDEAKTVLKNHNFAGLCLFAQNITGTSQITQLCSDIQSASSEGGNLPYLISCDQEGGYVCRLNSGSVFCGNMGLAATTDTQNAYECAQLMGTELLESGFNIDFAPDVDVNINPSNPVIGTRSFSDDPQIVATFGAAFAKGLNSANVACTLKHFPGHGDTATDSHSGLPCVNKSKLELDSCELAPFKKILSSQNVDCVMTAHIQFLQVETQTYTSKKTGEQITLPATLSKTFLTNILRDEIGYEGVICTDSMQMDAISQHFDKIDAAALAINAGVNILLMPYDITSTSIANDLDTYIQSIISKVNDGIISIDKINDSCKRIIQLKIDRKIFNNLNQLSNKQVPGSKTTSSSTDHEAAELYISNKSITVLKNDNNTLPINTENQKIGIMYCQNSRLNAIKSAVDNLIKSGKISSSATINYICYDEDNAETIEELNQLITNVNNAVDSCDQIVCFTSLSSAEELKPTTTFELQGNSYRSKQTNETVVSQAGIVDQAITKAHSQNKKFIQVSTLLPYDTARFQTADAILATYCNGCYLLNEQTQVKEGKGLSFLAALNIVLGNVAPSGKLPVNIPKINSDYSYSTTELVYARGFGITDLNPGPSPSPSPTPNPNQDKMAAQETASTSDQIVILDLIILLLALAGSTPFLYSKYKDSQRC